MKYLFMLAATVCISFAVKGQQNKYISIAGFTTQAAMPFAKFTGLFKEVAHPGIEVAFGKVIKPKSKSKHQLFVELKFAYFYHRFVQHGLPLYLNAGYRHILFKRFSGATAIGAGYMQSIPATAKFKLNEDGNYVKNKGLGRVQAIATFAIGLDYTINTSRSLKAFINYQQRIQFPFVKSYVPLLPYNSLIIGISKPLHSKK